METDTTGGEIPRPARARLAAGGAAWAAPVLAVEAEPLEVLAVEAEPLEVLAVEAEPLEILAVEAEPLEVLAVEAEPLEVLAVEVLAVEALPIEACLPEALLEEMGLVVTLTSPGETKRPAMKANRATDKTQTINLLFFDISIIR